MFITLASVHALSVNHCNLPMYDYILWRNGKLFFCISFQFFARCDHINHPLKNIVLHSEFSYNCCLEQRMIKKVVFTDLCPLQRKCSQTMCLDYCFVMTLILILILINCHNISRRLPTLPYRGAQRL